jgi:CheY-like chemotaxis protein
VEAAAPKRILVVDDEDDVALVLQYVIEDEGYEVVTATSTKDALAKAAKGKLDAAVLDVQMGETSGLQIAQALRAAPSNAQLPIIIVSGLDERAVRRQFSGYDLFVSKGADLTELVNKLAALTGHGSEAEFRGNRHP